MKLGAKEKLVALEKRASLDAATVAQLHKKRDELLQTSKRLRTECGTAHVERGQAFRELGRPQQLPIGTDRQGRMAAARGNGGGTDSAWTPRSQSIEHLARARLPDLDAVFLDIPSIFGPGGLRQSCSSLAALPSLLRVYSN